MQTNYICIRFLSSCGAQIGFEMFMHFVSKSTLVIDATSHVRELPNSQAARSRNMHGNQLSLAENFKCSDSVINKS